MANNKKKEIYIITRSVILNDFALTYLATITSAVATTKSVADKEYFNGKGTTPDGYEPKSSRSRLDAR